MKKAAICMALLALVGLGGQAFALTGTIDDVPAASLLLPYFAVDLDNPLNFTTLFSINNASAAPAIAHVVLWTDKSVPTLDFNVYLTGFDVVTFNLRDLFTTGSTPPTDSVGGPHSPIGLFSLASKPAPFDASSCNGQLPLPDLPPVLLQHIRASHTGQFSNVLGGYAGVDYGDNVARGYITVDNVNTCTLFSPQDGDLYFGDPTGANNDNQLWGDYFYVDETNNFAQGETLVHIEADGQLTLANYTFYRRYVGANSDQREGLGSTFAVRYLTGGLFSGGTNLKVWRDSKVNQGPFADPADPIAADVCWQPLSQNQIVIFDEMETPDVPEQFPFSPPIQGEFLEPFPDETNSVAVGGPNFPVPFPFGWLYLNLNNLVGCQDFDPTPPDAMQNWVTAVLDADGRFSVGFDAIQLDNVTFANADFCLTDLGPQGPGDGGATAICPLP